MDNEQFIIEVEKSHLRSKQLLIKKGTEYTSNNNRLGQFYRAGKVQGITPESALVGMATKHFTSICDMAKNPFGYSMKFWDSKITDLRNYTYLLDALLRDEVEEYDK